MSSISASLPSFPSLDPTYCAHTNENGKQCICRRCKAIRLTDDGVEVCTSCGHIESAHPDIIESKPPPPAPGIILKSYLDAGRHASKITASSASNQLKGVKASKEEALEETSAGLKKRKSDTDTAPPSKKAKGKLKATVKSRDVVVHKVVLLTDGIKNGTLNKTTVPSKLAANELKSNHLVILTTPAKPIVISNGWDNKWANQEVASLFRLPFRYITEVSPDETQHWVSLIAQNKTLHIADEFPTGADLIDNCSRSASGNLVLYLATKIKIPLSRQQNWGAPLSEPESDELGSEIQTLPSEDIIRSPIKTLRPKPRPIVKNVKKRVKTEVTENQSDMKEAATRRITRLADGSKKRTPTMYIPTSSDDEYDYTPMVDEDQKPVINVDELPDLPDLPQDIPIDKEFPLFLSSSTSRNLSSINDDKPKSPSPDFDFSQYNSPPGSPIPTTAVATSSSTNNVFTSGLGSSSSTASSSLVELPHIPSSYAAPSWSMPSWMTSVPQPLPFTSPELNNTELPAADIPNRCTEAGPQRFRKMGRGRAGRDPWAAPK
ncbi:hypothetical protein GGX14DRAFT_578848 [Mycena pura]|uniref:Uncharacterized protein n=1 Tax=Mycena pura TaxID=153505 RepID=A0AAD6USS8_9AGAR|nr:hypothetical protein GGX14DRAFT_578848 [Mycena pura]